MGPTVLIRLVRDLVLVAFAGVAAALVFFAVAVFVLRAPTVVVLFVCTVVVVVLFGGMAKPHIRWQSNA